jgi:hypothetical protein
MKKILLVSAALLLAHGAFSQGTIVFNNRAGSSTTASPGIVIAPIYGPEGNNPQADPTTARSGNTATGNPMGSQTYSGSPLFAGYLGGTWTATLWGLESSQVTGDKTANNLVLISTTTFRTTTSGNFAGTINQPTTAATVPGVVTGTDRGTFQMRVWDTRGGAIATWADVLANPTVLRGVSDIFTVPYSLGGTLSPPNTAPFLQGLQSFNVATAVPEPSTIALGIIGAGCLFLLRRRK